MANNKIKYTDEYLTKILSNEGYVYLNKIKKNDRTYVNSICPNGNNYSFYTYNWTKGKRCGCSKCDTKRQRWDEDTISVLCQKADITFISRNRKKVTLKCNKSGIEYIRDLGDLCQRPKCTCEMCGGIVSWTEERIRQEIEPYGYKFISKEYDESGKVKRFFNTLCPSGNPYKMNIHKFINGRRCTCEDCAGRIKWTDERIKKELSKHGLEYISHTITNLYDKDITYKCLNGGISTSTIHNLIARDWQCSCEKCTGRIQYTKERIIEELNRARYTYINHYYDEKNHLRVECECENGHYYNCNFWNFVHQSVRCDQCKMKSKGETRINDDFLYYGINFIHEATFPDCKYIGLLKFDFVIYDDVQPVFAVEYDGEQHFQPSRFGSQTKEEAQKAFEELKIRDNIKNEYCKNNNIPLVRVSYTIKFNEIFDYIKSELENKYSICINDYFNKAKKSA